MVQSDDDGAGREEQQRLEKSVRHQMKNRRAVGGNAERDCHIAQLRECRVRYNALDIVLHNTEEAHEERRQGANHEHDGERGL